MIAFFIIQRMLRRTQSAKSFRRGRYDRGNTWLIGSATGAALLLPIIFDLFGIGVFRIDPWVGVIALAGMLCGLALRIWAARTLGSYYTTTLMITENHKVVSRGPYSKVRHPGYLADIILWSGFGVLSSNFVLALVFPIMFVTVYLYRISSEEKMLVQALGEEYARYKQRTRRLIPYVY